MENSAALSDNHHVRTGRYTEDEKILLANIFNALQTRVGVRDFKSICALTAEEFNEQQMLNQGGRRNEDGIKKQIESLITKRPELIHGTRLISKLMFLDADSWILSSTGSIRGEKKKSEQHPNQTALAREAAINSLKRPREQRGDDEEFVPAPERRPRPPPTLFQFRNRNARCPLLSHSRTRVSKLSRRTRSTSSCHVFAVTTTSWTLDLRLPLFPVSPCLLEPQTSSQPPPHGRPLGSMEELITTSGSSRNFFLPFESTLAGTIVPPLLIPAS